MSDDKHAPAPQAPVGSGTSAPAAPRPSAEPRPSTVGPHDTTDVDPYKVRHVTIPPDMRVKMLDWWKNRRHEDLPKDTIPPKPPAPDEPTPKRTLEPDTIRNFPPPGKTPDSVTPVGVSTAPMKSLRGIAVAVALVAAALLLLVVILGRGDRPRVTEPQSAVSGLGTALTSEPSRAPTAIVATPPAASSALHAPIPAVEHEPPVRPNPVSATNQPMPPRAVAPPEAPRAAARTKTRVAKAEPRTPTKPVEPTVNQNSTQDPFEKPFFPPAK